MSTTTQDFKVKDLTLSDFGRAEIDIVSEKKCLDLWHYVTNTKVSNH